MEEDIFYRIDSQNSIIVHPQSRAYNDNDDNNVEITK